MKHDISPYTCMIEDCPTPYRFYTTRKDWREHFLRDHPPRWRCSCCTGKRPIFQTLPEFMTHLDINHQSQISAGSLERIMVRSTFRAFGISHCPLCNDHGFSDSPEIIEHVLGHVYDFSMYSLPWRTKTKPNLDGEILTFNPTPGPHVDDEEAYGHMRMLQWVEKCDPQEEELSAEIKVNLRDLAWGKEYRATDDEDQTVPNEQDYFDKDGVDYFEDDLSDHAVSHSAASGLSYTMSSGGRSEPKPLDTAGLRLLSLDGGGVRGLFTLMILEQLMEAVNPGAPSKPCDYFDMIGGTSTGG
jgi:hypothetical protein